MVLTVGLVSPCSVAGREVHFLEMELICSLILGDKEEERHKRGGTADK